MEQVPDFGKHMLWEHFERALWRLRTSLTPSTSRLTMPLGVLSTKCADVASGSRSDSAINLRPLTTVTI